MIYKRIITSLTAAIFMAAVFLCWKDPLTPYPFPELAYFPRTPAFANNPVTVEGAALGRFLFYDPILSSDSSLSCSGCHDQKSAFSDAPKDFSIGVHNGKTNRNAMPLFNLVWNRFFFLDGRVATLEDQISHPLTAKNEMNMEWDVLLKKLNASEFYSGRFNALYNKKIIDSTNVKNVIAQFLKTLISHESKFDRVQHLKSKFTNDELEGFRLMNNQTRGDCLHCHPTDGNGLLTTLAFSNNGLDPVYDVGGYTDKGRGSVTGNEKDNGKFMIPSLRNIALTGPYMHDGRFKTLEEVLEFYSTGVHVCANIDTKMSMAHQKGVKLSDQEKKQITAFLMTLTDSVFISKKEYSNPFRNN
ncbi:MAG: cytochrome peroxidase [Bacteroidota bacterium]|jgi:cytochrome c peroxidase|nr:cytochrome peroxidase [Bacteroidota bacterium]